MTIGPGGDTPSSFWLERGREEQWGEENNLDVAYRTGKQSEPCVFKMLPP